MLVTLGIIYNQLTKEVLTCSLEDNIRSLDHTSHCASSSLEGLAIYSDKNTLYSMNKFLSIPGMVFLLCFFLLHLQGLNQPIVSRLTKFFIY